MKKIAILLALSMMLGIFSGCGSTPAGNTASPGNAESSATPEPTPEATPEQKPVELRTVSMFGGTDPSAADYQQLLKSFMDQNPGITISDESATSDETWKARVTTDFASGNDPDVLFYFTGTDAKQLIENKKVVSIEEIQSQYPDYAKDISDAAMGFMKEFDGKHYAVPVRGYYEGLFCNKDLFDKYSLDKDIRRAVRRKVWLKSGGYLIFDATEAMTVIDVNSGKYTGKTSFEDTVLRLNLEAAVEIPRPPD